MRVSATVPLPLPETAVRQIRSEHTGGLIGVYVAGAADLIFGLLFPNANGVISAN